MNENNKLNGFGGWLILVGIVVVIAPIRRLVTHIPIYVYQNWSKATFVETLPE